MIKICLMLFSTCIILMTFAQQKEGKVIYTRTVKIQNPIVSGGNEQLANILSKPRIDKFELTFGNNQSLWKHVDEENTQDEMVSNGVQIRMVAPDHYDIIFHDFSTSKKVEQRDMMDKKFLIIDSVRKLQWKLTGETQTLLGHICQKGVAQRTGRRTITSMGNDRIETREGIDTTSIIAWFTTEIPVPAGPEVQGQLPGLILELNINNGRTVYKALAIQTKANIAGIKEPSKGKKVTAAEFVKIVEDIQKNNPGGGNRVILRR